jgi:thiamine-monophosphate kinase
MNQEENNIARTDINELGEFNLIDHLTFESILKQPATIKGIGDDAAVIDSGDHLTLVSTDMLVEGIHFDLSYTPLKHLGYKSIIVNLSDIYAMNAVPTQVTVSIAISNRFSVEALEELYKGINLACDSYNVDLVGGDTTSSQKGLIISVTAIGVANKGQVAYRSGARPGDIICVSGSLGAPYLGLQILEREKQIYKELPDLQPQLEDHQYIIGRLLKPEARKDIIEAFEKSNCIPTSMIDISDGLASELHHIAKQSGVGVVIEEAKVPIHPDAKTQAIDFGLDPITCALHGGEDYELLFTVSPSDLETVRYMADVAIIGEIVPKNLGLKLISEAGKEHILTSQGWNHFNQ